MSPLFRPEDRHEEEALELEVYTEDCGRRLGECAQDLVHGISHDGTDGHHQDGRRSYEVDLFNDFH